MYYNENKLAFKSWSRCLLRVITTGVLHVYMNDVQYLTRKFYMKRMTGVSRRHVYRSIWSYRKTYVYNIICSLHLLFDVSVFFVYIPMCIIFSCFVNPLRYRKAFGVIT